ncbi:hypothetical protein N9453_00785 [Aquiluna sp.]|jgi:hypothetical protein|nr:hypothetical protein [Aquiluna sp.]MDA7799406.1 hypothetical protein [Aquiluna sp.]MDA8927590.1 hypothetical protein [Aquiluna sp.]MDA9010572.1 hypothetical protein [Aquiluna sp.]MDB4018382.1 hypothetical protein [Aquiluna sp.]MDB4254484.1 hypothetical protein [Aquiluna sp.]
MELLIILAYAAILGLVGTFVLDKSDHYGRFVPVSISLIAGSALWLLLTWFGFSYSSVWIWFIVMLAMPAAGFFGTRILVAKREQAEAVELAAIRLRGKTQ